jgi:hypothetical protein
MLRAPRFARLALAASLLVLAPRAFADPVLYTLITPPSSFDIGCQGPCACPILMRPTYGSFTLARVGTDPLYTYYDVTGYIASFNNGPGAVAITGSGHYKIGGEFALVHEMTLDLNIEGRPPQHFDSGLVPIRSTFPRIDIECAVNGFACYDTTITVAAEPVAVAGTGGDPAAHAGIVAAWPNPFEHGIRIGYTLGHPAPVDLWIVDLAGRRVRALVTGPADAASAVVTWDGRGDDGRLAPAGVYWVLFKSPQGEDRRRIVKLD